MDDDPAGLPAVADPASVEPGAELVALLAGRATYDLIRDEVRNGMSLQYRCPSRIASPRTHLVVADHRCHTAVVPDLAVLRAVLDKCQSFHLSAAAADSEEVPF